MNKFLIHSVRDNDTNERSLEFGYREGRECIINISRLREGRSLVVFYNDNKYFATSKVIEINEDDYGFEVMTKNRIYYFKHIYEKRDNISILEL